MVFNQDVQMEAKREQTRCVLAEAMDLLHAHNLIERYEVDSDSDVRLCFFVREKDFCFLLQFFTGLGSSSDLSSVVLVGRLTSATEYLRFSMSSTEDIENLSVVRNAPVEELICREQRIFLNPLVLAGRIAEAILNLV